MDPFPPNKVRRGRVPVCFRCGYVKKFTVTRSDLLAAWGMGLIIVGVAFFLVRDLRRRFEQIDLFFDQLEGRCRYVPFIAPASALLGVFLILLAFVF